MPFLGFGLLALRIFPHLDFGLDAGFFMFKILIF